MKKEKTKVLQLLKIFPWGLFFAFIVGLFFLSTLWINFLFSEAAQKLEEYDIENDYEQARPYSTEFCFDFVNQRHNNVLYANNTRYYKINEYYVEEKELFEKCNIVSFQS